MVAEPEERMGGRLPYWKFLGVAEMCRGVAGMYINLRFLWKSQVFMLSDQSVSVFIVRVSTRYLTVPNVKLRSL